MAIKKFNWKFNRDLGPKFTLVDLSDRSINYDAEYYYTNVLI